MNRNVRVNALRTPQGISPDSLQKARLVLQDFSKRLQELGSPNKAAVATAAATRTQVKVPPPGSTQGT